MYAQCLLLIKWLKFKKMKTPNQYTNKYIQYLAIKKKKARIKKAKRVHVTRWWVGRLAAFYLCQRISMLRTQRLHFSLHSCHLGYSWISLHGFNRFQQMKKVRAIILKNFDLAALVMVSVDCKAVVMYNLIKCWKATI